MLIPGLLYGMLAGDALLVPQGVRLPAQREMGADFASGCWVVGFYLAFMPLYVLGAAGMPHAGHSGVLRTVPSDRGSTWPGVGALILV